MGDADLTAGNIKKDVNIFGVTGAYRGWTCTGTMNGTRWCDNLNGTVRDMTTGLIWLKNARWTGPRPFWASAANVMNAHDQASALHTAATNANLNDGSVEGDWRLPTLTELKTLTSGTEAVSSTNMRAFTQVQSYAYWSSTAVSAGDDFNTTNNAWYVRLDTAAVLSTDKTISAYVWPVRDGQ